jgi:tetratricopeptide (TPR) repeat protein
MTKRNLLIGGSLALACVAGALMLAAHQTTPSGPTTPTPPPLDVKTAVVREYYDDVNAGQYDHAFKLVTSDFYKSVDILTQSYSDYETIGLVSATDERDSPKVHVKIRAVSKSGNEIVYEGTIKLVYDAASARWLIDHRWLNRLPPSPEQVAKAQATWAQGNQAMDQQRFDDAAQLYTDAINADPDLEIAYVSHGNAEFAMRDYEKASADYETAMAHDQNLAEAYLSRGTLRWLLGHLPGAEADFSKLVNLRPDDAGYAVHYATVLYAEGKKEEVQTFYQGVYAADATRDWALMNLLDAIAANDGPAAVLAKSRELNVTDPDGAPALARVAIGHAHFALGEYEDAISWLTGLLSQDPNKVPLDALNELIAADLKTGRGADCFSTTMEYARRSGRPLDSDTQERVRQNCNRGAQ